MCYNIAYLEKKLLKLAERYKEVVSPEYKNVNDGEKLPLYYFVSGFSHPALPVIKDQRIEFCNWGLIPSWAQDEQFASKIRTQTLNAVGETVFEKPSFRNAIKNNRCLLPVSGFFEWREVKNIKYPYFINLKNEELFSLGCIYDSWVNKETGETIQTFSIITTPANPMMNKIHNNKKRMPLIVSKAEEKSWIKPTLDIKVVAFFYNLEMYYTYIIYSKDIDRYYIGSTNDLLRRLEDHKRGKNKYTKIASDWELKYSESFENRSMAYKRELQIKNKKILGYIQNMFFRALVEYQISYLS